jgi:hypothetical protein
MQNIEDAMEKGGAGLGAGQERLTSSPTARTLCSSGTESITKVSDASTYQTSTPAVCSCDSVSNWK